MITLPGRLPKFSTFAAPFCAGLAVSSGHAMGIAISVLMPAFVLQAPSRRSSYGSALSYYAGALWPLIPGANNFFGPQVSILVALLLWATAVALLALPWLLVWSANIWQASWRAPIGLLLTVVPPLGIVGWASPLTAAGILFPGTAWIGLFGCAFLTGALAIFPRRTALTVFAMALHLNLIHPAEIASPHRWVGIDTHFGPIAHGSSDPLREYLAAEEIRQRALSAQASVIVFPETVVSYWTAATDEFWRDTLAELKESGKTILIGARIPRIFASNTAHFYDFLPELAALANVPTSPVGRPDQSTWSPSYFNSVVIRGEEMAAIQQRVPVPLAMWNPLRQDSVPLNLTA